MRLNTAPPVHLTYCLNVHPGETWDANLSAIATHAAKVRDAVAPDAPFGLGLRVGARAAATLVEPGQLARFKDILARQAMYVFTINGFPYGPFHGAPVKTSVYRPDWRDAHRLAYTNRLADILAALLPEGVGGSISTVPVAYRPWIQSEADLAAAAANLAACAQHLAGLAQRTGRRIRLALEPEPDCYIEDTPGTIRFFNDVFPAGEADLVREYVGVCFDTCHLAVAFESVQASLAQLVDAGIAIPKLQVSAALHVPAGVDAAERLAQFADPVYLHQVKTRRGDGMAGYDDLPAFLAAGADGQPEARVHCHVPLYFDGDDVLRSTHDELTVSFFADAIRAGIDQFEIETYTFDVLPPDLKAKGVVNSIMEEYRWVLDRMPGNPSGAAKESKVGS